MSPQHFEGKGEHILLLMTVFFLPPKHAVATSAWNIYLDTAPAEESFASISMPPPA